MLEMRQVRPKGVQGFKNHELVSIGAGFKNQFFQFPVQYSFLWINNISFPPVSVFPLPFFSSFPFPLLLYDPVCFVILSPLSLWVKVTSVNVASASLKKPWRELLELSRTCASVSHVLVLTKQSCLVSFTVCLWLSMNGEGNGERKLKGCGSFICAMEADSLRIRVFPRDKTRKW